MLTGLIGGCGDEPTSHISYHAAYEDQFAHAVSHILIRVTPKRDAAQARKVIYDVYAEMAEGKTFEQLAQTYSEHDSRTMDGFIGFVPTKASTRFSGAVQALQVGQISRPVETKLGYQIIKRHSFEEGRDLEAKFFYAVYGFVVPWKTDKGGTLDKPAAHAACVQALKRLRGGVSTLVEERARLTTVTRGDHADAFIRVATTDSSYAAVVIPLSKVKPGAYADVVELQAGFAVVQRRRLLRGLAKHILISHLRAPARPIQVTRTPEEANLRALAALQMLLDDPSAWDDVLKQFTDDDTHERPGGLLGVVTNGDIGWPLEEALLETKPGSLHPKLVQSNRGFEIIFRIQ